MPSVPHLQVGAPAVYLVLRGGFSLLFSVITTINLVYQAEVAGLNPLQLVLVGTVLEAAVFLFEVPTGVVADVYGRRLSVITGHAMVGVGFLIEGFFPHFAAILMAQVVWGAGWTFISGAREAWIADEVGEERAGPLFLRGAQAAQFATLAGIPLSVALASLQLNLPIVLGGGLAVALALLLALIMPEHGFRPAPRGAGGSWQAMGHTLRSGVQLAQRRPVLGTIMAIGAVSCVGTEGFGRLWTPHLLDNIRFPDVGGLAPVVWFGVIRFGGSVLSIAVTEVVRRRLDSSSHTGVAWALLVCNALLAGCFIIFGLAAEFSVVLATLWSISMLGRTTEPLWHTWVNLHVESKVRATVFSISSQAMAVGQIVGGPALGALATAVSLPAALVASGLVHLPVLPLFVLALRQGKAKEVGEEEA